MHSTTLTMLQYDDECGNDEHSNGCMKDRNYFNKKKRKLHQQ